MSNKQQLPITIVALGQSLNIEQAQAFLIHERSAIRYRDAYLIPHSQGQAWLFDYGILVAWNMLEEERLQLCNSIGFLVEQKYERAAIEQFHYRIEPEAQFSINFDCVVLPNDEVLVKLALSHAFAQSTKLIFFEEKAQQVIQDNAFISKELAKTGKVPLSRVELAKLRGILFDTSSDITLHFNLLDTPEFFWDYPELEEYYLRLCKYLDLNSRLTVLDKKLQTIHNLLDMLAGEQHHKHSAFLEWIIIVLIAVDILIYFF
jgi:uncharacterized Rmd1/YagE family protein